MTQKEFQRVKVIENAVTGRLKVSEAASLLQLSEPQVQRLKRRYRHESVAWVRHGNPGRPMPWALPAGLRRYHPPAGARQVSGFNDSHLCEKLQRGGETRGQSGERASHPACGQAAFSAEAPPAPVPRPSPAPSALRCVGVEKVRQWNIISAVSMSLARFSSLGSAK
jgi:hypothetical protein